MNPLAVANKILNAVQELGLTATHMQLQKLLYFANGWHLEITGGDKLTDAQFEAWQFGPVMPAVYHEFKHYGASHITGRAEIMSSGQPYTGNFTEMQGGLIEETVSVYGPLSGAQLSKITHKDGSSWDRTWNNGAGKGDLIRSDFILEEFRQLRRQSSHA